MDHPLAVCLLGPTAAGKSELALAMCRAWNGELISVDSAQIYRGMDIGTAKPDSAARRAVPHHLIDVCDPAERYSAARFVADALALVNEINERGRLPVLAGGSMFYFRALLAGLPRLPAATALQRRALSASWHGQPSAALHRALAARDSRAAARIHPNNRHRLLRALEIHQLTGQAPSLLRPSSSPGRRRWLCLSLTMPKREQLHQRIAARAGQQLAQGLVAEVSRLRERGDLNAEMPALRSVCYRQVWEYLDGDCDSATMHQRILAANRQLARRQLTWLRHWPGLRWLQREGEDAPEPTLPELLARGAALLRQAA